ncbi:HsdR family type I site-specific deoxyribonuclease [bacterium AH-315-K20]|nr:HsdR family type I site-specific deoxyribonuclease [bacterium AH-315-K20]
MNGIGQPERVTQNRVVKLFQNELGYEYLGNWTERSGNSNIETEYLERWLTGRGHSPAQVSRALDLVRQAANRQGVSLYDHNKAMYSLLRYGVPVKVEAGETHETVALVDWEHPEANDFAIAEEVTLKGEQTRRPDIVLYVNGIALVVLELKRSRTSVTEGIRQNISNQKPEFNQWFFSTVQLVLAGNDSEGLRYATTDTPEKYWLTWKEDVEDGSLSKLDKYLIKLCGKDRLIELARDFVLFDGGVKKVPRVHQYFGVKAAQEHVRRREGGIIWHTQGSGKSIVMVMLARWILENNPNARVVVITDRDELDKQIERVFRDSGEDIARSKSGRGLMAMLGEARPRLMCSLLHKFGRKGKKDKEFDAYIEELEQSPSKTVGEVFVFVDECHRSQSGRLHRAMKAIMPSAVFVGFTGTPLLKEDKQTSLEVFGGYIHTYKFSEAVEDGVVLDLVYEARDIDQRLGDAKKIDEWFEAKTRGLNDWQKQELQSKWGTMQRVLSSRGRMERVVADIVFDFGVKPRLSSRHGNALLVASSIYEACKYYELFQKTVLKGRCAVITSYDPQARDVTLEDTGANTETDKEFIYNTYTALLQSVAAKPGKSKTETYEDDAKRRFVNEPATMQLLIAVNKLLTGFDAPPCTYLYIDKSMQDHGLFQAICRTNRLDGDDKTFGYIVDYKDLFNKVENALAVYTSEIDHSAGGVDPEVLIQDRLKRAKERLDEVLEKVILLCEPVEPPREELEHIRYFCGQSEVAEDLAKGEPLREQLYKLVAALVRAYAGVSDDMAAAGYTDADVVRIKGEIDRFLRLREIVKLASGETIDLKAYEADMRHLIDTYIEADEPTTISPFGDMPLMELIVKSGIADAIAQQLGGLKGNQQAVAETIENNVRRKIIKEQLNDPAFFERMSRLLDELIAARRAKAIEYAEYLKRIAELAVNVQVGHTEDTPEPLKRSPAIRAIYNLLVSIVGADMDGVLALAQRVDATVRESKPADFRGNQSRENTIKQALLPVLDDDAMKVEQVFRVIRAQAEY